MIIELVHNLFDNSCMNKRVKKNKAEKSRGRIMMKALVFLYIYLAQKYSHTKSGCFNQIMKLES